MKRHFSTLFDISQTKRRVDNNINHQSLLYYGERGVILAK